MQILINGKRGISLITLVITIIVMAILSGAVILSLTQSSPIGQANEATFKADLDAIKSEYNIYITSKYVKNKSYNPKALNANDLQVIYNGKTVGNETIKDIITTLKQSDKYNGQFEITDGVLVYVGADRTKKRWAVEANVEVLDADRLDVSISTVATLPISAGTDVPCLLRYSSNAAIDKVELSGKLELLDENDAVVDIQPSIQIGNISGTNEDTLRNVDILIKTDMLFEGRYKIRLKPFSVYNIYDVTINKNIVTNILFEIDNTPPENPIMNVNPATFTNGDVTLGITYPVDAISKQYSLDGETWLDYTNSIIVTESNTTIYARAIDIAGNQSGQSSITIANIDKESPTVTFSPNGGSDLQVISSKVIVTDVGNSNINNNTLEYVWDTQNTIEPLIGWEKFTNGDTLVKAENGTYYLWIKAVDNAGNMVVTKSNVFAGDLIPPENPTMSASPSGWTNSNVTVSITYPGDVALKEYSTNAVTWNTYTVPVIVTTNGVTVYARGKDEAGNQSGQSTLTVTNIDKEPPSAPVINFNGYTPGTWSTTDILMELNASDDASGIGKYQWSTNKVNWHDFQSSWTYNYDTVQNTAFRVVDNAGNPSLLTDYYNIKRDTTSPTYTSYSITNVTSDTYDVYLYGVEDVGSGVNRVQFPTWTVEGGQDDLASEWWVNSAVTGQNLGGGTWKYTAKRSEHNNEYGAYLTHIYIYDNLGNYKGFGIESISLENPHIVATFNLTQEQEIFNGSNYYSTYGQVSNNYTIEFDAQPSSTIDVITENDIVGYEQTATHRFILMESHGAGIPNAGLGVSIGTNGLTIIAHSAGYYHVLLTYYTNLNAWNHYKIVVENRVPRLYINGVLIKTGYTPSSSYTNIYTIFSVGAGFYGNFRGRANNFVFYDIVK